MKIASILFTSVILIQACASNAIKTEDRPLLNSVQLEPSKVPSANIDYRGLVTVPEIS